MNNDLSRFDEDTVIAFCDFFDCTLNDLLYVDREAK